MKNPVVFLLQIIAWVMLVAVVAATWAGVTYPSGRAKAYPPEFSKIHPMCIHRVLIEERYEGSTNLEICHAEYKEHPIKVRTIKPVLGDQQFIEVTSTKQSTDGGTWVVGYSLSVDDAEQDGPFLINMFHRFPDQMELSSLAGISRDKVSKTLNAHFLEGGNDRCQGGHIEVMGMAGRKEIALSQAATLYAILNPIGQLLRREDSVLPAIFPGWKANQIISDSPQNCVGRLIGIYDHASETTAVTAIAVDLNALLMQSRNQTEACAADAIVRANAEKPVIDGSFSIYDLSQWSNILYLVHRRCGLDQPFNPINHGI